MTAAVGRSAWYRAGWPWLVVVSLAVLVLSWPMRIAQPLTVDLSWRVGLQQAAADGLRFGQDIMFTYGPLGFLAIPTPFLGPGSALAFIATAAIYLALIAVILIAARRLFPWWAAVIVTLVFARAFVSLEPFEALQVLTFALGVEVLRRDPIPNPITVSIVAGMLAGFAILGKLNVGVFMLAMAIAVVLAVSRPRWLGLGVFGGAVAVTIVGLWIATGQQLTDLIAYGRGSLEIISGYSEAMVVTRAGGEWILGTFVLVAAILFWVAWRAAIGWSRDRQLALAALVVVLLFATWKFAFIRYHAPPSFVTLALATLVLLPRTLPRSTSAFALVAVCLAFLGVGSVTPALPAARYLDVVGSSTQFVRQATTTFRPWRWDAAIASSRHRLQVAFPVSPDVLAELDGHTVHIDPYAAAVASAYPVFTWHPVPIFQSYSAYTPWLDEMNADLLRSSGRPERILRQFIPSRTDGGRAIPYSVDGRFYWFESPAATLERLCRYHEVMAIQDWQVLAPTGQECGVATPLGTRTASVGEVVQVPVAPSADSMVIVRIRGFDSGPLARIRSLVWRAPTWQVQLDGFRYRFVAATADDGLVLSVPASAQGSAPFSFGPPVRTIEIREADAKGNGPLTFEFEAVPLPGS